MTGGVEVDDDVDDPAVLTVLERELQRTVGRVALGPRGREP